MHPTCSAVLPVFFALVSVGSHLSTAPNSRPPVPVGAQHVKYVDSRCSYNSPDSYSVYVIYVDGTDSTAQYAGHTAYSCGGVGYINGTFVDNTHYQACVQANGSGCPSLGCSSWLTAYFGGGEEYVTGETCE